MNLFGNNYKNSGLPKPKSKQNFRSGILCAIMTIFCIFIRSFVFAAVLGICAIFYFVLYCKHKETEEKIEADMEEYEDDEDSDYSPSHKISRQEKKKRKAEYEEYLQSIEDEFHIDDIDEDDEFIYEDEEDDEF